MLGAGGLFFKFSFWAFSQNNNNKSNDKRKIASKNSHCMKSTNQENYPGVLSLKNSNFRLEIR